MSQLVNTQADIGARRGFKASRIDDDLSWGVGAIQPIAVFDNSADQKSLLGVVLDSLEEVSAAEMPYSACTDGRVPVRLLSGEPVPVREQNVGADTMLMFHMAEALGTNFYKDASAPLQERVQKVVEFMHDNGLVPSTHIECGAAANYVAINKNLTNFVDNPQFVARQKALLPQDVYDESVRDRLTEGYQSRLDSGVYDDWQDKYVLDAVRRVSGDHAVAQLHDDDRGIHGHVEEQIIRIKIDGVAINEAKVTSRTNGREVFGVNDLRFERLARLLGRGQDQDYRIALMAAEDFTDGAHGTLAKNLPTYIVETD